jgi:tRNA-2-methylthio-N6-dimethylallyladenosine synthase
MDGQVPADVVQERYERLTALVEETSLEGNRQFTGQEVEVLVADGEGRKDQVTHRMSGRARDNRLVHFAPAGAAPRPGDVVTTVVTRAAPHYLIADGEPVAVRRTRGGDAWAARRENTVGESNPREGAAGTGGSSGAGASSGVGVLLGMPTVGRPA